MPSPIVINEAEVVKTFDNLEIELRKVIRREVRDLRHREAGGRIADELVALVRSRWDNAPSLHHWWTQMDGGDFGSVPLNSLYDRLDDLGVSVDRVLRVLARTYGWLASPPLLIVDDTSAHKFGLRMEGASSVRVANIKCSVLGHTVVTLMLASPGGALFLDHEVKVNPSRPRLARHPGRPIEEVRVSRRTRKWEMALELIRKARAKGIDAAWVLFDCAYFNAGSEVPRRLTKAHVNFISKAKSSDSFIIDGKKMTAKEFQSECASYKRVRQTDHFFCQKRAMLMDGTVVKLVATWFFRGRSLKKSRAVLVTNALDTPGASVVLTYLQRWQTERGYQDWKRSMGGMAYHATDFKKTRNYIRVGFLAYALARRARQILATPLGLPTLLAVRKRTVRTMMATRKTQDQDAETMIQRAA